MGANAQIAVPSFTAGQILTATQQSQINTGIPVFATTVTRDAAFGGTGEKVLAEGQFAYIEATNTTQYYDGAAWQTVGINPGLVCVKAETAFSGVSSFTADSVFSSSYTNYVMNINFKNTLEMAVTFQLRASGTTATTNYNWQRLYAFATTVGASRASNQSSARIGSSPTSGLIQSITSTFFMPNLANPTNYMANIDYADGSYPSPSIYFHNGNNSNSTAYDGIIVSCDAGTMTGTYTIYGYSKTV